MMKKFLACVLCLMLAILPACAALSPAQSSGILQTVEEEFHAGNLTQAQRDAAVEAIISGSGFDWASLGLAGVNIALALIGAPMIVRLQRGKPTQTYGLSAALIKPAEPAAPPVA